MSEQRYVVQFPHPGPERIPESAQIGDKLDWNIGDHGRKYVLADAQWTDGVTAYEGRATLWCEWEPQSSVLAPVEDGLGNARWLQQPHCDVPAGDAWRQNTDPLVFGDGFIYSNCRQATNSKLRSLARGSLVLFGSKLGGRFCLDTVIVIDGSSGFRPVDGLGDDPRLAELIIDPLALNPADSGRTFRLYRGATTKAPVDGMFSFSPCLPYDGGPRGFARPALDLGHFLTPNLAMQARCTVATAAESHDTWSRVVDQVLSAGLMLGTHFAMPTGSNPLEAACARTR
jgi:hypothetical protein